MRKEAVNEEEISEPFAREQRKVNGGHKVQAQLQVFLMRFANCPD